METARTIRSFAADFEAAQAAKDGRPLAPMIEFRPGDFVRFAVHMPPAAWADWYSHIEDKLITIDRAVGFLRSVVVTEDRELLERLFADPDRPLPAAMIFAAREDLISHYLARPTTPAPSSSDNPSADGPASAPSAASTGSTPSI